MLSMTIMVAACLLVAFGMALYKYVTKKKIVEHYYTPFDHIFGQTQVEFHEQKVEKKEEEEDQGDDQDKLPS